VAAQIDSRLDTEGETGNPGLIADPGNPIWKLRFKHIATGESVSLAAWVTDFSDTYTSQWNEETVYGRMDPLVTFQQTRREISVSLDVIAANKFEAINNTAKVDKLIRFLYPVYGSPAAGAAAANTLKSSPLIEIGWANFITGGPEHGGLIGYLGGLTYTPVFESGLFINHPDGGTLNLFPQQLRLQFNLKVLHTHLVGWTQGENGYTFGGPDSRFPHNGDNPISAPIGNQLPCADGPWVPDSAINVSENQRTRRLMAEEQAANQEVLQGLGPPGTRRRRIARLEQERNRGHNYNAGCENPPQSGPATPEEIRLREAEGGMPGLRGAQRRHRRETREFLREQEVPLRDRNRVMNQMRTAHRQQRRGGTEVAGFPSGLQRATQSFIPGDE
tara:strand:+ start:1480 stop:2646 length:1167 start_codon:yes stop_codon:yes gene_type:complete